MCIRKSRSDGGTPERPAEERSCEGDQLQPQNKFITAPVGEQEKSYLEEEEEMRLVESLLSSYDSYFYRRMPRLMKERVYNQGKQLFVGLLIRPSTKDYAHRLLANYLRI